VHYVEKKFMEVNYNMMVQNHVKKKITLWDGGGVMVKNLTL
jgi:hypothetical protein